MSEGEGDVKKALSIGTKMEEGAQKLYSDAYAKVKDPGSKQLLKELAADEAKHKAYFEAALKDRTVLAAKATTRKVQDLKITDPLRDTQPGPDATYQEILIFAAKSEQTAHDFYSALAKTYSAHPVGKVWAEFAEMEAGHKLKIEKEYDEVVLREN